MIDMVRRHGFWLGILLTIIIKEQNMAETFKPMLINRQERNLLELCSRWSDRSWIVAVFREREMDWLEDFNGLIF